jgi:hypothetical protein
LDSRLRGKDKLHGVATFGNPNKSCQLDIAAIIFRPFKENAMQLSITRSDIYMAIIAGAAALGVSGSALAESKLMTERPA